MITIKTYNKMLKSLNKIIGLNENNYNIIHKMINRIENEKYFMNDIYTSGIKRCIESVTGKRCRLNHIISFINISLFEENVKAEKIDPIVVDLGKGDFELQIIKVTDMLQ